MDRKYRTFENRRLLDIYEKIILDSQTPSADIEKFDIEFELLLRMEQVDADLEKKVKKVKCEDIEKMNQAELTNRIKTLRDNIEDPSDLLLLSLLAAQKIWRQFCDVCREPSFSESQDEEKVNFFKDTCPEFFNKYPVIANMLVCRGLFSLKAFRQFLIKSKEVVQSQQTADEKRKNWCHLRAYYVEQAWRYLSKSHNAKEEGKKIYEEAFKRLDEDYRKFEQQHDTIQEDIARNELLYRQEALEKIIKNINNFEDASIDELLAILE